MIPVRKAAVLGAGTMGAQIAAHLANAGIPTLLLDILPREAEPLSPQSDPLPLARTRDASEAETRPLGRVPEADRTRPLGGVREPDRNRIARAGLEAAKKAKPAAFFISELAS